MAFIAGAIIGGAILGTVGSAIASGNASSAATNAANVQAQASNYAADIQRQIYDQTRNDLTPFQNVGRGVIPYAGSLIPGGFQYPNTTPTNGAANPVPFSQQGAGTAQPTVQAGTPVVPTDTSGNPIPSAQIPANQNGGVQPGAPGSSPNPATSGSNALSAAGSTTPPPTPVDTGTQAQSPFLTGLENALPGSGSPTQNALAGFLPGSATPNSFANNLNSFIPGSGVTPNSSLTAAQGFIPGSGVAPNAELNNLTSFIPGSSNQNSSLTALNSILGLGSGSGTPDSAGMQKALENTPGYQFTLNQGLKATQNSYAAQGLGSAGAAIKGSAQFATGLADQTYQQQVGNYLNNYNSQFTNAYNIYNGTSTNALNNFGQQSNLGLNAYNNAFTNTFNTAGQNFNNSNAAYTGQVNNAYNLLTLGSNAAAQTGTIGANTAAAQGNYLTSGAAATAGGIVGSANALNAGITSGVNSLSGAGINAALLNGGSGGGDLNMNSPSVYNSPVFNPNTSGLFG